MFIEFDPVKRAATLTDRGLDMARAGEIFEGLTLTVEDRRQDYGETRFMTIGFLDERLVIVLWTPRGDLRRIISLRKANSREQTAYLPRFSR